MTSTLKKKLQVIRKLAKDELQKLSPLIENLGCEIESLRSETTGEAMSNFTANIQLLSGKVNNW